MVRLFQIIQMGSKQSLWERGRGKFDTDSIRECGIIMEAEITEMQSQAKKCQQLPESARPGKKQILLHKESYASAIPNVLPTLDSLSPVYSLL